MVTDARGLVTKHRESVATRFGPLWMWLVLTVVLAASGLYLHYQGRPWWCACGELRIWSGNVQSRHNSQHLFDPYSFTHVLHGLIFYGLAVWAMPRLRFSHRLFVASLVEIAWELVENSQFVIDRYRATNIALGYEGDSIANVAGDVLAAVGGVFFARRFGMKASVGLFIVTEVVLLVWIRDGLLLSGLMLIYPSEAINAWQANT